MTNFDPGVQSEAGNAFVPTASNPFLASDLLTPQAIGLVDASAIAQMMPAPDLTGLGSGFGTDGQGSLSQLIPIGNGDKGESPVLLALANELAPDYPQLAKALVAPTLNNALQSGVGLVARGSERLEANVASGKLRIEDTAREVGGSVWTMAEGAVERVRTWWNTPDNAARREVTQQIDALANEIRVRAEDIEDSAWMLQLKAVSNRRLETARGQIASATEAVFSSLGYVDGRPAQTAAATALEQAELRLKQTLIDLRDRPDFIQTLETAFGEDWTAAEATAAIDTIVQEDSGPVIETVESESLLGDGAFGNNTVFISEAVLAAAAENPEGLDEVLLEEIGHYFDQRLNVADSAGDEGAIFARLALGEDISAAELQTLKSENDHSTITVNNEIIHVENRAFLGGSANHSFTAPPLAAPVPKPPAKPTPVDGSDRRLYLQAGTVETFDAAFAAQPSPPAPEVSALPGNSALPDGRSTVEVKAGDTLSAISAQHGVQWTDLRKPDGTAFTEAEASVLQIGADVVLPSQPVPDSVAPPVVVNPQQPKEDSALIATASPYASVVMNEQADALIEDVEAAKTEQLFADSALIATASPYASAVMNNEATKRVAEVRADEETVSEIEQLQTDSELLATASPAASGAMQAEAEMLLAEEKRQEREQLQADAELIATASPYASKAMQAEVDALIAEERREDIAALNQVDGRGLEHRFAGTNPEAAALLGTGNYDDNFLSGLDLDLADSEQAANDYNGNDNHITLQSIFDPVVADKPTTIDEYSVQVELPDDVSPDDILLSLATDMDGFLGGEFAELGDFKNQGEQPTTGQIIDIDVKDGPRIFGWKPWFTESPFNAPVLISEMEDNNFTVQTIEYNNAEHLLHGTREWGYEQVPDGTVRFYTRGISVEDIQAAEGIPFLGKAKEGEYRFWNAWIDGIEDYAVGEGGSVVEDSRLNEQTEGPSGNDIWETLTFEQQEMIRAEQIAGLERELERHLQDSASDMEPPSRYADDDEIEDYNEDVRRIERTTESIEGEIEGWRSR